MIPDEPGVYMDRWGNVWRKWRDGLFSMVGDRDQRPDQYAPFVRLFSEHHPPEASLGVTREDGTR